MQRFKSNSNSFNKYSESTFPLEQHLTQLLSFAMVIIPAFCTNFEKYFYSGVSGRMKGCFKVPNSQ